MRLRSFASALGAAIIGLMIAGTAMPASAFERTAYTNDLIQQARTTGRPYIIFVHADWCVTCQAQDRVLETLVDDPRFADLLILTIDYDTKRNLMMIFNVGERSTFIAFNGTTELGRSWADTTPEGIEAFLTMTMAGSPNYVPGTMPPLPPAVPGA
ncbi:MAG: thioredoxin family protein [Bauldia sp.]